MNAKWIEILATRISTADLSIIACVVAMVFFMKYNQHEAKNKANFIIAIFLGVGFTALIAYRIFG